MPRSRSGHFHPSTVYRKDRAYLVGALRRMVEIEMNSNSRQYRTVKHGPVEERACRPPIAVHEWMVVREPEVQDHRAHSGMH